MSRKETDDEKFDRQLKTFRDNRRRYLETPQSERKVWVDPKHLGVVVGFRILGLSPSERKAKIAEEKMVRDA